jgi:hypothetical protein
MHTIMEDTKGGALKTFDLFRKAAPDLFEKTPQHLKVVTGIVYAILAILILFEVQDWMGAKTELNFATSVARTHGLRALFSLKVSGQSLPGTVKSPSIEIKGKEKKICNLLRINSKDLFGAEDIGEVGKVDCFLPGVMGRSWYEAGNYAPLAPARKRVATTSPGLLAKFQSPVSISNGPDKYIAVLYFDDSQASAEFLPAWGQGVDRASGKMQFEERGGTRAQVLFQQVNCDEPESENVCSGGPALYPSVVMYQREGPRTFAILPDDIEEVLAAITGWMKKIGSVPKTELKWPISVSGWIRLPNVPGQLSYVYNLKQVSPNEKSTQFDVEMEHVMFEPDKGVALAGRFTTVPTAKRKLLSPLMGKKMEIRPGNYHHWYTKLVPTVLKYNKIEYQASLAGFKQASPPKLARAVFRLNYDISTVGFKVLSSNTMEHKTWYDLACKLSGLVTGAYLVNQLTTGTIGVVSSAVASAM